MLPLSEADYFRAGVALGVLVGAGAVWYLVGLERAKAATLRAEARVKEAELAVFEAALARFDPSHPATPKA